MTTGEIARWNDERGFGFIRPDIGDEDVFVHCSAIPDGKMALARGTRVQYEIAPGKKPGQVCATNVTILQ